MRIDIYFEEFGRALSDWQLESEAKEIVKDVWGEGDRTERRYSNFALLDVLRASMLEDPWLQTRIFIHFGPNLSGKPTEYNEFMNPVHNITRPRAMDVQNRATTQILLLQSTLLSQKEKENENAVRIENLKVELKGVTGVALAKACAGQYKEPQGNKIEILKDMREASGEGLKDCHTWLNEYLGGVGI